MKEDIEIAEAIKCREIMIYDSANNPRLELRGGGGNSPATISFIQNGRTQMQISSDDSNYGAISIYDGDHKLLLSIGGSAQGCGIALFDKSGLPVSQLSLQRPSTPEEQEKPTHPPARISPHET